MGVNPATENSSTELMPGVTRCALEDYLALRLVAVPPLRIASLKVAGQGMSDDTLLIDAVDGAGTGYALAIRRYRREGILRELVDPARHYQTLVALAATSIPAPRPLWFDPDCEVLHGPCFAMRRIAGQVPIPWSPEGRKYLARHGSGHIGERFVQLLADIHALDWQSLGVPDQQPGDARARAAALVAIVAHMLENYRVGPEPVLTDAVGWLNHHLPTGAATTLVHGDYRTGNLMFADGDIAAILDWEFALPGDPMRDIAWVLAPSNRVDSPLACYLMEPAQFVERYEQRAARRIDWPAVRFWQLHYQVFNALGWMHAEYRLRHRQTQDLRMLRWSYTMPVMRKLVLDALREVA